MRLDTLDVAIALAQRFVAKGKAVKDRAKTDKYTMFGCKETGELRRTSMDLTRILADLRGGK